MRVARWMLKQVQHDGSLWGAGDLGSCLRRSAGRRNGSTLLPRLRPQPRCKRDPQCIRKARHVELRHQIGAVDLDRARADAEVERDRLVGQAVRELLQHVALARGQRRDPDARGIRFGTRLSCLLLPWLVGIAIYALTLRVMSHGWTSDRLIAAACLLVASCYATGYAWAASRYGDWLNWIANVNVGTAFITLLVMAALFSPLMDPARLSVASQMARLDSGKVGADQFDFEYLRFQGARYGQAALQELTMRNTGPDAAVIRARATAMLMRENRFDETGALSDVAINLTVRPAGVTLPQSFLQQDWSQAGPGWRLPACLKRAGQQCDAYAMDFDGDGKQEVLLISNDPRASSVLLAEKEEGGWYARGQIPTEILRCRPLRDKLQAGQFALVPPKVQELEVDGQRVPMSLYNEQEVSCPQQ